jgi:hypothetical protein
MHLSSPIEALKSAMIAAFVAVAPEGTSARVTAVLRVI